MSTIAKQIDSGWMKFVEVKTKTTTSMVFIFSIALALHIGIKIRPLETALYIVGTLLVDLATTAVNNYMGYKKEGEVLSVDEKIGRWIIFGLFFAAAISGILLILLTKNILLLFVGGFAFLVGALYTTGPLPISATPLGEVLSGGVQGYINMLVFILINAPAGRFMALSLSGDFIRLDIEWSWLIVFLLLGWIPTVLIANVMLANNTCDIEKDRASNRYTLPQYLGLKRSLLLFEFSYYSIYLVIIALVTIKVFSPIQLLVLLTLIPVYKNIKRFKREQIKAKTFVMALSNLAWIMLSVTLSLLLSFIIN